MALALLALSGGRRDDPQTPGGLPGLPAPLFGVAVVGSGGRTAAIDAYGDVVDLRAPGPAGRALVAVPADRQAAGTVPTEDAIVARARLASGRSMPFWRADSVRQRYVPGTNVLITAARFGGERVRIVRRVGGPGSIRADRRWLARARPLGTRAPRWARRMHRRSLLVLRALTDRHTGAVVAGARDGWAYVWPRDAAAVGIALASAGYRFDSRRIARFLLHLDLGAAARFGGTGAPVPGRDAQGDAAGWVAAAARAAGLRRDVQTGRGWRGRADYQEGDAGDHLANAIASTANGPKTGDMDAFSARRRAVRLRRVFETRRGLVRVAGQPGSGLDSAAAWAVRPFPHPALFPAVRRTLLRLSANAGPFGLVPSESWSGGEDPWTAPTAWTAWALAALSHGGRGERRSSQGAREKDGEQRGSAVARGARAAALRLMTDLRRAATPLGLLPERVDAHNGLPRSTTPLAWSHAFAILALHELWPGRAGGQGSGA